MWLFVFIFVCGNILVINMQFPVFENLCRFHEIFQKLDMKIRVSGWCEYAPVGRDWFFLPFCSLVLPEF